MPGFEAVLRLILLHSDAAWAFEISCSTGTFEIRVGVLRQQVGVASSLDQQVPVHRVRPESRQEIPSFGAHTSAMFSIWRVALAAGGGN